jgi:hypothetical protein
LLGLEFDGIFGVFSWVDLVGIGGILDGFLLEISRVVSGSSKPEKTPQIPALETNILGTLQSKHTEISITIFVQYFSIKMRAVHRKQ